MSAVLFQTFESSKSYIHSLNYTKNDPITYSNMIISGAFAGIVSCVITAPTELIKIEVQVCTYIYLIPFYIAK